MSDELPLLKFDHVGVIVSDLDRAVAYYESLGIGPFRQLKKAQLVGREVYGKPAPDVQNTSRHAPLGPTMFELVLPIAGKSAQQDSLDKHGEGISHIGFEVDDIVDAIAKMEKRGFKVISRVKQADGTGSAYFDTDKIGGVQFELIQRKPKK